MSAHHAMFEDLGVAQTSRLRTFMGVGPRHPEPVPGVTKRTLGEFADRGKRGHISRGRVHTGCVASLHKAVGAASKDPKTFCRDATQTCPVRTFSGNTTAEDDIFPRRQVKLLGAKEGE